MQNVQQIRQDKAPRLSFAQTTDEMVFSTLLKFDERNFSSPQKLNGDFLNGAPSSYLIGLLFRFKGEWVDSFRV